ncbi:MAG TPA: PEP-CTERM sorting domain-containing protein [Rubrivivax sp.]|mgnify:CR=1 FL=1|nr:PEP-CTERM sorting domain-containing protein [Rubrivivax sp.]
MRSPHGFSIVGRTLAACAFSAACGVQAAPTTEFSLSGAIDHPAVFDRDALAALPAVTQTVTFLSGSTPQTHTFAGASLWGMLNSAGIQTNPAIRNDIHNRIVVAQGSDGYRAVYSLGELNPGFGNLQALAAYDRVVNGSPVPLGSDGFARTTAPDDVRGGRYVSNLSGVQLQRTASTVAGIGGGQSSSFSVSGDVLHSGVFDLAALQALTPVTQTIGADTYVGVSLWSLLNDVVGLVTDPSVHNDLLGMYVVATGSDGYKAAFALGELSPSFGNNPYMIAYQLNGQNLDRSGFARVVVPADVRNGRWVSNLIGLEVFHAAEIPEPPTYALLALGLLAAAWPRRRRER